MCRGDYMKDTKILNKYELHDLYTKVFYGRYAKPICPECGKEILDSDNFSEIEYIETGYHVEGFRFYHRKCLEEMGVKLN